MGGGKDGSLYVLNRDQLGGADGSPTHSVQLLPLTNATEIYATGAFWSNHFYIAGVGGLLSDYLLNPAIPMFSLSSSSAATYAFPGATPSVSAAGAQNGIVWALDTSNYCTTGSPGNACLPAVLHAYDATNLAMELWNSSMAAAGADAAGRAVKFTVPTIANGKVYVGTRGNNDGSSVGCCSIPGELDVYGLKP
jgi:hypothetical protein